LFEDAEALDGCAYQWHRLAERYRGVSSRHLSFNLLNEVARIPDADYERVVRRLVGEIRCVSPRRLILIDGLEWGGRPLLSVGDLLGIIQCGRGYQPMLISHYAASWVFGDKPMAFPREQLRWPLDVDGQHYDRQWLLTMQKQSWSPLEQQGGQVFIGEFGSHNQTPHSVALAWLADNLSVFRELGWGWALWNLRGSFGILDSGRSDVDYEDFHGHKLDRKMLAVLQGG
jgi:endoglucanase